MEAIAAALAALELGPEQQGANLTVFPLLGAELGTEPGYLTLDEALGTGQARVTEVSSGGSVPELRLENRAARPVLLLDGEELVGAKQNRVLNLTILVAAGEELVIPVSCVEAGRWHDVSAEMCAAPRAHFAEARAHKAARVSESLREAGVRCADQGEVWADIDDKLTALGVDSPSAAMADAFEGYAAPIEDYVAVVEALPGQLGAVFAIDGEPLGVECFDHPRTLAVLLPKLVRSYALDAIEGRRARPGEPPDPGAVRALLDEVAGARVERFPALGIGEDLRFDDPCLVGGALVAGGRVVHLCAFRLTDGRADDRSGDRAAGLAPASYRRARRR